MSRQVQFLFQFISEHSRHGRPEKYFAVKRKIFPQGGESVPRFVYRTYNPIFVKITAGPVQVEEGSAQKYSKMRKFVCLSVLAAAAACYSCSDSEPVENPPAPLLEVMPESLTFPAAGGSLTVTVTARGVQWTAEPSDGWLSVGTEVSDDGGTLTVTALPNDSVERLGSVVVKGEGVEDVVVTVVQESVPLPEPEPSVWDRSSACRMNLNGPVRTAGLHGSYADDTFVYDLGFDGTGMLVSFARDGGEVFRLDYDAENRLTSITREHDGKSVALSYGSHGKYVAVEELFTEIQIECMTMDCNVWLPRFIRNLERISADGRVYSFSVSDGGAEVTLDGEPFQRITYDGDFPAELVFPSYFGESRVTYGFNRENGNILTYELADEWGGVTRIYNDDRLNTLARTEGDMPLEAAYNNHLDMVSVSFADMPSYDRTMEYAYDAHGNWTGMKVVSASGTENIEREVTYR